MTQIGTLSEVTVAQLEMYVSNYADIFLTCAVVLTQTEKYF